MDKSLIIVLFFFVIAAGGLYFGVLEPMLSGEAKAEKRKKSIQGKSSKLSAGPSGQSRRRDKIAETLKAAEERSKSQKVSLEQKLMQAGLKIDKKQFFIYQLCSAAGLGILVLLLSADLKFACGGLLIGGFGIPNFILSHLQKKRIKKFIANFPEAIDMIVRGVKAGMPLGDCIKNVSVEAEEPIKSEFRNLVETQTLGMSIAQAVERIPMSVPTQEANFFAIVINIQQKAGGNLAEALSGLSKVLRDRRKMKEKIIAISTEATASAAIIGALPPLVGILVYWSSPHYIELLWIEKTGQIVLVCCAVWMLIGVLVMRKMINFDF